jgi:hypothetical protein
VSHSLAPEPPARYVARLIAQFDPRIAHIARHARQALRRRLPTAVELVYDNFHALALEFGSTDQPADCIVSLAITRAGVRLNFLFGAELPDPDHILLGESDQTRFIPVDDAALLGHPPVEALICAAVAHATTPLPASAPGPTIIKSVAAARRVHHLPTGP